MREEDQVFEGIIDALPSLTSDGITRQQVEELHYANCNCFIFLRFNDSLAQVDVFDHLSSKGEGEVGLLSHIPPVVTVERRVLVGLQGLKAW